jgi:hypothetical protein
VHFELVEALLELLAPSSPNDHAQNDRALDSAAKVGKYSSFTWNRIKEAYGSFQTCGICGDRIRRICAKGDLAWLQA